LKFEDDFADMRVENELKISHRILCEDAKDFSQIVEGCGIN
jgi:hypothetical protein